MPRLYKLRPEDHAIQASHVWQDHVWSKQNAHCPDRDSLMVKGFPEDAQKSFTYYLYFCSFPVSSDHLT